MRTFWAIALLALAGCSTATAIHGPDGLPAQYIECNGGALTQANCFQKAAEVCPRGYALLGGGSETGPYAVAANRQFGLFASAPQYRAITVRCK